MKKLKLILIGGGDRGKSYTKYLDTNPDKFELVAIAEPVKEKRDFFKEKYNIPEDMCFEDYNEILKKPRFADIVMICTQDKMHFDPAMKAIEKKYDLLLEKPVSINEQECFKIATAAKENNVRVLVCHVLRFTQFFKKIKSFIEEGELGEITNIIHEEDVGNIHMSHSYVRGNWRRKDESSPMILAKCCHDTDLLSWLVNKPCKRLQSFGSCSYFNKDNAPEGAPMRCLDGCPHKDNCYYYAPRVYSTPTEEVQHFRGIVANKFNPTDDEVNEALKTSQYGRCVFYCDNDVVDRQVVSMEFEGGAIATITMSPFNYGGRKTTIMGTNGELHADIDNEVIEFYSFKTRTRKSIYNPLEDLQKGAAEGHGGGDYGIMDDLYEYIANDNASSSISDIAESCMGHFVAFAAEKSREEGTVIDMDEYIKML